MINDLDILETYINIIKKQTSLVPDIAIILGSGLNSFIKMVKDKDINLSNYLDINELIKGIYRSVEGK